MMTWTSKQTKNITQHLYSESKMFYLSLSLGDYLETTLQAEIYTWIA